MSPAPAGPGPAAVFTRLYEEHRRPVYAFLLGRSGDPETAGDLLQEVFLRAWRHIAALATLTAGEQRSWVFAVARNLAIDAHRASRTRDAARAELLLTGPAAAGLDEQPAARAEMAECLETLSAAIRRLPEPLRVALALCTVGELTSAQAGELLGEPAGTVRYRLSLARRQLSAALLAYEEGRP
ncbi:MAG TPA: RNA polymerase sigma factor [Candidatus Dormibacteraeota bacterium]|nr:RNA polymerase sigma factor [Candidatus Dormibacteraeota bacterium]